MRVVIAFSLALMMTVPASARTNGFFACYGDAAVGFPANSEQEGGIARLTPERYFTMQIGSDEASSDRFKKDLTCVEVPDSDELACSAKGVMFNYNRTTQKYVLTAFVSGAALEVGRCSWVNGLE